MNRVSAKERIVIVGGYPPPIGGVSVYVQRLVTECRTRGMDCIVLDPHASGARNSNEYPQWVVKFPGPGILRLALMMSALLRSRRPLIAHIHTAGRIRFLIGGGIIGLMLAMIKQRAILTIHGGSFISRVRSYGWGLRVCLRSVLRLFDDIIVVNRSQRDYLVRDLNIPSEKVHIIPAFILPRVQCNDLPGDVERIRSLSRCVLVGSGYGTGVYAHHLLVEATKRLQEEGYDVGLLLALYSVYERKYMECLRNIISSVGKSALLEDLTPEMFNAVLASADVYVRTSEYDGDCVALREAMYNGCVTVASDCVDRPGGCITFRTGDTESLCSALKKAMVCRVPGTQGRITDYLDNVLALYTSHLG